MLIPVFTTLPALLSYVSTDLITSAIVSAPIIAVGAVSTSMTLKNVISDSIAVREIKNEIKKLSRCKEKTSSSLEDKKDKKKSKSLAKLKDKIYKKEEKDNVEEVFDSKYLNPNLSKNLFDEEYNNSSTAM